MVESEVCQGFTADEVKAALRHMNTTKSGRTRQNPSKVQAQHGRGLRLTADEYLQKSRAETKFPQEWTVTDIRPTPKGWKGLPKMESYRPISLTSTEGKTMERLVTNRLRYFAESTHY